MTVYCRQVTALVLMVALISAAQAEDADKSTNPVVDSPASQSSDSGQGMPANTATSPTAAEDSAPDTVGASSDATDKAAASNAEPSVTAEDPGQQTGDEAAQPVAAASPAKDAAPQQDGDSATAVTDPVSTAAADDTVSADTPDSADATEDDTKQQDLDPAMSVTEPISLPAPEKKAAPAAVQSSSGQPSMGMAEVIALVQQQQAQLAQQQEQLASQSKQLNSLRNELDALRAPPVEKTAPEEVAAVQPKPDDAVKPKAPGEQQVVIGEAEDKTTAELNAETGQAVATAQADDPTAQVLSEFPGAWRLPGTRAALAVGGYVKSTLVYNNDPLEIIDRFIVGSIPVDTTAVGNLEAESSLTASQSRLNFDLREPTDVGILRAFIEGDFASEGDTFRLRHAFGQWNRVLAGKTWSAFVDTKATPEEVDFEGLNGRISLRQTQVRISPRIGETFEFQFSLEDPNPQIQNGDGVTRAPDVVMSGRFQPNERLHTKVALMARQIRAQLAIGDVGVGGVDKQYAWGLSVSGRYATPRFDKRDSVLFQLNTGDGIGRYVNDLASVGNYDGIVDPQTGELRLFDVFSGYISGQHWWGGTARSNVTLGYVEVDNPDFVAGDAYKKTIRASANIFWTPTPRIDIGVEYLWGRRENENGDEGDATQVQAAARYRFR